MRTGSVVFHELYFGNLGGNGTADANCASRLAPRSAISTPGRPSFAESAPVSGAAPAGSCWDTTCITGRLKTTGWQTTCTRPPRLCRCS